MDGEFAVRLGRQAVNAWVRERKIISPKNIPESFKEKSGAFVTLHTWPEKELRGCIGFAEPVFPLHKAIIEAAASATMDPRFEPLQEEELGRIIVEVSILTKPGLIKVSDPRDYKKHIKAGEDGLIVESRGRKGLLLPQVATDHGLDAEDFLIETCLKAGLPPTAWMDPKIKVYRFRTEIWSETRPNGDVKKV